ncbi:MAG: hypothetical protein ACLFPL_05410 [Candidatus Nanoarchaeia archaeon]
MVNVVLLTLFSIYIISLLIGFSINYKSKKELNKKYHKFKGVLLFLIGLIFAYSTILFFTASLKLYYMGIIFCLNILFIIYFSIYYHRSRCWKQHLLVHYNFLVIPFAYLSSLLLYNIMFVIMLTSLICVYTVMEFQFAKFSFKQKKMWD